MGDIFRPQILAQLLEILRERSPAEQIQCYQDLRGEGLINIAMAARLIFMSADVIAGAAGVVYDEESHYRHIAEVVREHGEEQLAEILEDPDQRRQFLDWQPPKPN